MDYVREHLDVWASGGANLLFGGVLLIIALTAYVKDKRFTRPDVFVRLFTGTALMAASLLYVSGLVSHALFSSTFLAVLGILLTLEGIGILAGTLLTSRIGKALSVVLGIVMLVMVTLLVLMFALMSFVDWLNAGRAVNRWDIPKVFAGGVRGNACDLRTGLSLQDRGLKSPAIHREPLRDASPQARQGLLYNRHGRSGAWKTLLREGRLRPAPPSFRGW